MKMHLVLDLCGVWGLGK